MAEIGRILRRRRGHVPALRSPTADTPRNTSSESQWACSLECFLLAVELPGDDEIHDYDDLKTPKADLVILADAYRIAGLLEIYSLYPDLLEARRSEGSSVLDKISITGDSAYSTELCVWMVSMASHILHTTKPIPVISGGCRLLPLLLTIAGGQLRFPDNTTSSDHIVHAQHNEMIQLRYLVEARMLVLSRKYAQRPILQMLELIKEVWQRLDNGDAGAHWLEVVHEMGWQTIMG